VKKKRSHFVCQSCGSVSAKWSGRCDACGEWDCIVEEVVDSNIATKASNAQVIEFEALSGNTQPVSRVETASKELDRVLGGGAVQGSVVLIGGDPGIGKSTLVLQLLSALASQGQQVVYVSGEESSDQVRLRAKRLNVSDAPINLLSSTSVEEIIASLEKSSNSTDFLVIDSIQTMHMEDIASAPGTVSQVRASAARLIQYTKSRNMTLLMVGHVTKEGQIAGPKVLEHMVDTVLYFEGDRGHQFRILRAVKNRFGAANEIAVFEMQEKGLQEVSNPSEYFLSDIESNVSGSVVFAGIEGSRPVLVEIQALVVPTPMATPRRAVVGWDSNRLAMVMAILQARYGLFLADKEVYLNVVGGLKISEPAADMAVAAALISSFFNIPLPSGTIIVGEMGLSGEIRSVPQMETRVKEAKKLGFESAISPKCQKYSNKSFILKEIAHIRELKQFFKKSEGE
jgi:DNA repair protein RadA/Sms